MISIKGESVCAMEALCSCCSKPAAKMMRCGRCSCARYCSKDCQRADWEEHKGECADLAAVAALDLASALVNARVMRALCKAVVVIRGDFSVLRSFLHCLARAGLSAPRDGCMLLAYRADPAAASAAAADALRESLKAAIIDRGDGGAGAAGGWRVSAMRKDDATLGWARVNARWMAADYAVTLSAECGGGGGVRVAQRRLGSLFEGDPDRPCPSSSIIVPPELFGCGCFVVTAPGGLRGTARCAEHRLNSEVPNFIAP